MPCVLGLEIGKKPSSALAQWPRLMLAVPVLWMLATGRSAVEPEHGRRTFRKGLVWSIQAATRQRMRRLKRVFDDLGG